MEESGDAGSPEGEAPGAGTSHGSSHRSPEPSATKEEESQRRVESEGDEPLSDAVAAGASPQHAQRNITGGSPQGR